MTQPETTRGVAFSKEELHIFRQWFENVQDVNPVYLAPKDYRLARHVYQCLQWVVPGSVEEKCNG